MPKLFNESYCKSDLYRYSSNISQLANIEEVVLCEGRAGGMKAYNFRSTNGLAFTALPSRCLDISALSYKGINISLLTRNGQTSPQNIFPVEGEFDRYFSGGMLYTCGLKNAGASYTASDGHFHHLHGRVATLPTESSYKHCCYKDDEYVLTAGATTRDTTIEGHNLEFCRKIKTTLSTASIKITDTIENIDINATDYLLLYHFNFGFPFLSEQLELIFPQQKEPVVARNEAAQAQLASWKSIIKPQDNIEENVFFHTPVSDKDGTTTVRLENKALKIGAYIKYETKYLPFLVQWRCLRSGEYALGIEPSNNLIGGMQSERAKGNAMQIKAGEKHTISVELGFYELD